MPIRSCFLVLVFFGCLGSPLLAQVRISIQGAEAAKPNIVFILADDLGWADLGCYGVKDIQTPHIDRLAGDGVRFTRFYANGPECSPTRTALLTGRYQQRVGGLECAIGLGGVGRYEDAIRLASQHELGLPAGEATISRQLKEAGYSTAIIGKWHLGYEDPFAPKNHGFDYAFYCQGGGMDYFHHVEEPPQFEPVLRMNGEIIQRQGYFTELVSDEAVEWLTRHASQPVQPPFFLYLPFTAPHSPYQGPEDRSSSPLPANSMRWKQGTADPQVYAAMIESLDQAVGRVLETLEKSGLANETLVIFTSDNGGTGSARPTGLRGQKGTTFEGGIRVPCIARWPGRLPADTECAYTAVTFDLTASMARLAGVTPERPMDGIDILSCVASNTPPPDRSLFWRQRRGDRTWRGVRSDTLKFVSETHGNEVEEFLFDLATDDAEQVDLFAARPEDARRLKAELSQWENAVKPVR